MASSEEVNIKVAVRVRPINDREKKRNAAQILTCDQERKTIRLKYETKKGGGKRDEISKSFSLDNVFGQFSTQAEVFQTMVAPIVEEVVQGFNCTCFAYGQTGTGKTHTMEGSIEDPEHRGVIPRSVHFIFDLIEQKKYDCTVRVSYLELYNEELNDLLSDEPPPAQGQGSEKPPAVKKLMLCDSAKGVVCNGLTETVVTNAEEVFACLRKGISSRQVAETLLNKSSSRSHSIFTLKMMIKEVSVDGEEQVRCGQLNLVDLAGSECVQRSGANKGDRKREAGNINQSLLTLGRVINGLASPAASLHIPYRDSKLTRLLQESLGGRAKTCIIAAVSPADDSADESQSTLQFASNSRQVKNKPICNALGTKRTVLKEMNHEMEEMRLLLQAQRDKSGTFLPTEKYEEMLKRLDLQEAQLEEATGALNSVREEAKTERLRADGLVGDLSFAKKLQETTSHELDTKKQELAKTESELESTSLELCGSEAVVSEQAAAEAKLASEANTLTASLDQSGQDLEGLFAKIQRFAGAFDSKASEASEFGREALGASEAVGQTALDLKKALEAQTAQLEALVQGSLASAAVRLAGLAELSGAQDASLIEAAKAHAEQGALEASGLGDKASALASACESSAAAQSKLVAEAAAAVKEMLGQANQLLETQKSKVAALSSAVASQAEASCLASANFAGAHCAALDAAREATSAAVEAEIKALEEQKASVTAFATSQSAGLRALACELAVCRAAEKAALEAQLASEAAKAEARKQAHAQDQAAIQAELGADADALVSSVAAAVAELKAKHARAAAEALEAEEGRQATGTREHAQALTLGLEEATAAAEATVQTGTSGLEASVAAHSGSVSGALGATVSNLSAANGVLGEACQGAKQEATKFAEEMRSAVELEAREGLAALGEVEALATEAQAKASELEARHTADLAAKALAQLSEFKAAASGAGAGLSLEAGALRAHAESLEGLVGDLTGTRGEATRRAVEAAREEAEQAAGECLELGGPGGAVARGATAAVEKHQDQVAGLEGRIKAHLGIAQEPLQATGATPVKRGFERPDPLTRTRRHSAIRAEAKADSSRDPSRGRKKSKLATDGQGVALEGVTLETGLDGVAVFSDEGVANENADPLASDPLLFASAEAEASEALVAAQAAASEAAAGAVATPVKAGGKASRLMRSASKVSAAKGGSSVKKSASKREVSEGTAVTSARKAARASKLGVSSAVKNPLAEASNTA